MPKKIAIHPSFGGYCLSDKAEEEIIKLKKEKGIELPSDFDPTNDLKRDDPELIEVLEKLGKKACRPCCEIVLIEIPDDVDDWYVEQYDGAEWVAEGRKWYYQDGKTKEENGNEN